MINTLLALDLNILELRIWITIIIFYWIWNLKYLDYEFKISIVIYLTILGLENT